MFTVGIECFDHWGSGEAASGNGKYLRSLLPLPASRFHFDDGDRESVEISALPEISFRHFDYRGQL